MYNIIPLILILISFSIIIFIVVKKFSVLASMDVENIPAEKEAIVKERIISSRLKRNIFKWGSKFGKVFRFFGDKIGVLVKIFEKKLHELRDSYKTEVTLATGDKEKKIEELSAQAKEMIGEEEFKEAERKFIEIIGLDSQNLEAFRSLGDLYLENKNYEEAKQTFKHILKLMKDSEDTAEIGEINFNLALVGQASGNLAEAIIDMKEALKCAPNNPRYLDTMLEISIIKKDKISALDTLGKLEKANPGNQKLEDFREQIKEL